MQSYVLFEATSFMHSNGEIGAQKLQMGNVTCDHGHIILAQPLPHHRRNHGKVGGGIRFQVGIPPLYFHSLSYSTHYLFCSIILLSFFPACRYSSACTSYGHVSVTSRSYIETVKLIGWFLAWELVSGMLTRPAVSRPWPLSQRQQRNRRFG